MNQSLGSTILMVTHDPMVGSYADRVLFLKDGKVWNEVYRGGRSRQALYQEIVSATAALGGDTVPDEEEAMPQRKEEMSQRKEAMPPRKEALGC